MEDKEKALEQLSGRVTESQKTYFTNEMEGSFAEKIAELIKEHKTKVKDNTFNVEANKTAIKQALNVIVKNVETIELNAKNYVQDIKSDIEVRVNALEEDCTNLNNVKIENEKLKDDNETLLIQIDILSTQIEDLKNKSSQDIASANIKYSKLKEDDDTLHQDYMKLKLQFGDMKEDLTRKNISLTEILNKFKEDHAAELAKLNKEAVEKINGVSTDYTELKIKTDATISKLDKELAVSNSVLESKNDLIKRLEDNKSKDDEHLETIIGPMAVYYSLRCDELESILKTHEIAFNPNNFQNGGRESIVREIKSRNDRPDKSENK